MVDGYRELHYRLFSDRGIAERIRNKTRYIRRPLYGRLYGARETMMILGRVWTRALAPGGWTRTWHFVRSLPFTKPGLVPLAITDWVVGLSMRDYIDRHFVQEYQDDTRRVRRYVERMKTAFLDRRHRGALGVSSREFENAAAAVWISMKGRIQPVSFKSIAEHTERLLSDTRSSVTLNITAFHGSQAEQMARLLQRLSRYGDRVHIRLDEASRTFLHVDSSVFHLTLRRE
jgi:hypothetical protein